MATTIKELKRGDMFTLKPIAEPHESQVYIRGEYDRSERKYWAGKFSDIGDGKLLDGNRTVYTDFTF